MAKPDIRAEEALRDLVRLIETGRFRDVQGQDIARSIPFHNARALLQLRDLLERRP